MKHLKHIFRNFNLSSIFSRIFNTAETPTPEESPSEFDKALMAVKGEELIDEAHQIDHEAVRESFLTTQKLDELRSSMWSERVKKYEKLANLKPFIDELWTSFLIVTKQGGKYQNVEDYRQKLNILGEVMLSEDIFKLFQKSDDYKIETRPWRILFTNQNGEIIDYNLEFFSEEHGLFFRKLLKEERERGLEANEEEQGAEERKYRLIESTSNIVDNYTKAALRTGFETDEEKSEKDRQLRELTDERIKLARENTTEEIIDELKASGQVSDNFPEELLDNLPLDEINDFIADLEWSSDTSKKFDLDEDDISLMRGIGERFESAIADHFNLEEGEHYEISRKVPDSVKGDISRIKIFFLLGQ